MILKGVIVIIVGLVSGVLFAAQDRLPAYQVDQVLSVRSASEFECRLKDYPYTKNARFRVQIRSLGTDGAVSDVQQQQIIEQLGSAKQIRLENVQMRNYFRVVADVVVDGVNLASQFARTQSMPAETADTSRQAGSAFARPSRRWGYPAVSAAQRPISSSQPPVRVVVTMDALLSARVNLSAISDQTSFGEALEILSDSVRPPLPLVVLWNDLENNALIDKDMPVGLSGFGTVPLRQGLELILHSVSRNGGLEPELAVEGGVITIGTQRGLLQKSSLKSYPITDLVSPSYDEYGDLNYSRSQTLMQTLRPGDSR